MTEELSGENVLVTGGAGFIGSTLVRRLVENGNRVTVVDNFLTGSLDTLKDALGSVDGGEPAVDGNVNLVGGDLLRVDFENLLRTNDVDYVFHLAAEPFIPNCYDKPGKFFSINANGTLRLLMACSDADIERVVYYSSSEIYGTAQETPMDESHRVFPQSTYAVSKLAADRLAFTQYHENDVPVVILRQFNAYGPRETHPYIVPELISQFSDSNELHLGNVEASRDLTYVEDAARAAAKLANSPAAEGEVVNVGYGEDFTVEYLAETIASLMGYENVDISVESERFRPLDVQQLQCDYSKATDLVGYEPTVSLEEGLVRTIEWYESAGDWVWERSLEDKIWK